MQSPGSDCRLLRAGEKGGVTVLRELVGRLLLRQPRLSLWDHMATAARSIRTVQSGSGCCSARRVSVGGVRGPGLQGARPARPARWVLHGIPLLGRYSLFPRIPQVKKELTGTLFSPEVGAAVPGSQSGGRGCSEGCGVVGQGSPALPNAGVQFRGRRKAWGSSCLQHKVHPLGKGTSTTKATTWGLRQ